MGRLIRGISKNARFFVADTTDVVQEALDIHKYDEYSMKIFGKFCTLASLMGATLKGEDKLTIRTDTDGYKKYSCNLRCQWKYKRLSCKYNR